MSIKVKEKSSRAAHSNEFSFWLWKNVTASFIFNSFSGGLPEKSNTNVKWVNFNKYFS